MPRYARWMQGGGSLAGYLPRPHTLCSLPTTTSACWQLAVLGRGRYWTLRAAHLRTFNATGKLPAAYSTRTSFPRPLPHAPTYYAARCFIPLPGALACLPAIPRFSSAAVPYRRDTAHALQHPSRTPLTAPATWRGTRLRTTAGAVCGAPSNTNAFSTFMRFPPNFSAHRPWSRTLPWRMGTALCPAADYALPLPPRAALASTAPPHHPTTYLAWPCSLEHTLPPACHACACPHACLCTRGFMLGGPHPTCTTAGAPAHELPAGSAPPPLTCWDLNMGFF